MERITQGIIVSRRTDINGCFVGDCRSRTGLFARRLYVTDPPAADRMVERFRPLHTLVYNKYWIDELYDVLFVNSIVNFSRFLWKAFDEKVIDGIVNGVAGTCPRLGKRIKTGGDGPHKRLCARHVGGSGGCYRLFRPEIGHGGIRSMANVSFPILSYITFVPLIGVVILLFLNRERLELLRWVAIVAMLVDFVLSLVMFAMFDPTSGAMQLVEEPHLGSRLGYFL